MDDLLALLDENAENDDVALSSENRPTKKQTKKQPSLAQQIAASADDRIGIRMVKRSVSGMELMNMITDRPYHSPAQLSAYSLADLNKLLVSPAAVLDVATVSGRTELITAGIVFSNSGTRLSTSGNAFCVVTLGNLKTGPCVSLLLFGESCNKHCRTCTLGKVVAVVNPRLVPPKSNSNDRTSVSFSVSDEQQLIIVADAQDYGQCRGMTRGKNEQGQWVSDGRPCQNFIDKRLGAYCATHRTQGAAKGLESNRAVQASSSAPKVPSSLQQVRMQSAASAAAVGRGGQAKAALATNSIQPISRAGRPNSNQMANGLVRPRSTPTQAFPTNTIFKRNNTTLTCHDNNKTQSKNHMLKSHAALQETSRVQRPSDAHRVCDSIGSFSNSCKVAIPSKIDIPLIRRLESSSSRSSLPPPKNQIFSRDMLEKPKPQSKNVGKRKRIVNTDMEGFQGSVSVPAPTLLFTRRPTPGLSMQPASCRMHRQPLNNGGELVETVRAQQQIFALRLKDRTAGPMAPTTAIPTSNKAIGHGQANAKTSTVSASSSLFGPLDENFRNQILAATSRFANEANAEEYARGRRAVDELEQQEAKKSKKDAKRGDTGGAIEKEWYCKTCNESFRRKPTVCLRSDHQVTMNRTIRSEQSVDAKRMELTAKKVEDGGLVLGSGLEWSGHNVA